MTDENKKIEIERECFLKSKWFKKFILKALAVFVGTYSALCLFAAMHKPPMPPCPFHHRMMHKAPIYYKYHNLNKDRKFHKHYRYENMKNRIEPNKINVEVKD